MILITATALALSACASSHHRRRIVPAAAPAITTTTTAAPPPPPTPSTTSAPPPPSTPAPTPSAAIPPVWRCVNRAEEGGHWSVRGARYSGGLGIMNAAWAEYRPASYPASAADASPAEQVAVARKILAVSGPGAWSTGAECGLRRGD